MSDNDEFCDRLGYHFDDHELVVQALAHRSWCAENDQVVSNERLEFLGDSVLGLVVTDHIFRRYPDLSEGQLAKLRSDIVSSTALAEAARALDLGSALLLGKGEGASGGRSKNSILADAMEAVIGAVYLDGGWMPAQKIVLHLFSGRIEHSALRPGIQDFKTRLQELSARDLQELPDYAVADEGPDHQKHFTATVSVGGRELGSGEGRSKKEAEQAAASAAWEQLESEHQPVARPPLADETTKKADQ